jgi:hypothetical protein
MGKAILIVVFGMTFVAGKTLTGLNKRGLTLHETAVEHYEALIARNIANSGANMAISKLFQDPKWTGGFAGTNFNGGQFSATLTSSDNLIALTTTGKYGKAQKAIQVKLLSTDNWPYVIYANNDADFSNGKGEITGDVHANNKVKIGNKYTLIGTVTQTQPYVAPPNVDWNFFANKASAAGQYVVGDKTFSSYGGPYTGVWYITNTVKIENNAVINGTIVAGNDCLFTGNNVSSTITAPENYPAILAKNSIVIEKNNATISGFVYAGNDFKMYGNNLTLLGAIAAFNSVIGGGNNMDIIYDETYTTDIVGIDFNSSGHSSLQILSWQQN